MSIPFTSPPKKTSLKPLTHDCVATMLRYAFMSFSTPDLPLEAILRRAADLGYDGVEPRLGHAHGIASDATPAQRQTIRKKFADSGIALCCIASQGNLTDPQTRRQTIELHRRVIELAGDLSCPRIRIFGGQLPADMSRQQAVEEVAVALREPAAEAHAAGTMLCLETHDDWCDPEDVAALMERVDHPGLAVNWDMMHPTRAAGVAVEEGFNRLRPWIRHVHIHDGLLSEPLTFRPCGEGELDIRTAIQCLVESDYSGFVSGEWIDAEGIIHLEQELERMKALEKEIRNAAHS